MRPSPYDIGETIEECISPYMDCIKGSILFSVTNSRSIKMCMCMIKTQNLIISSLNCVTFV